MIYFCIYILGMLQIWAAYIAWCWLSDIFSGRPSAWELALRLALSVLWPLPLAGYLIGSALMAWDDYDHDEIYGEDS